MSSDRERVVSLGQVAGHAVRLVQQRSAKRSNSVPVVTPALPDMPDDLARQVAVRTARFGDFAMTSEAAFHPEASAYAAQERRKLEPASPERICRWLMMLAEMLGNRAPKLSDAVMQMTCRTLARDLPAVCWEDDTLMTVLLTETHWPAIPRLKELLGPIADEVRRKVGALDDIAKADPTGPRFRAGPAREAIGYVLPPPPPEVTPRRRSLRERGDDDIGHADAVEQDRAARARALAQFTALGLTPEAQAKNVERGGEPPNRSGLMRREQERNILLGSRRPPI
jgi:hypothetical protein